MKKQFKFFSALFAAAAMMASCSNDDPVNPGTPGEEGTYGDNYLSISLQMPTSIGSRAEYDNGNFTDGDDKESKIDNVFFFFFDSNDNVVDIQNVNNPTFTPDGVNESPYVTSYGVRQIRLKSGLDYSKVAVILNSSNSEAADYLSVITNLSDLEARVDNYADRVANDGSNQVMSNSVYFNMGTASDTPEENKKVILVDITDENIYTTDEMNNIPEGKLVPDGKKLVDIYVERVVARINVKAAAEMDAYSLEEGKKNTTITVYDNLNLTTKEYEIQPVILGMTLTVLAPESKLIKPLRYNQVGYGFNTSVPVNCQNFRWNDPANKRSYWATTTQYTEGKTMTYYSWDDVVNENMNVKEGALQSFKQYINPNTLNYAPGTRYEDNSSLNTKLMIVAQLQGKEVGKEDATFENLDFVRYGSEYMEASGLLAQTANTVNLAVRSIDWYALENQLTPAQSLILNTVVTNAFNVGTTFDMYQLGIATSNNTDTPTLNYSAAVSKSEKFGYTLSADGLFENYSDEGLDDLHKVHPILDNEVELNALFDVAKDKIDKVIADALKAVNVPNILYWKHGMTYFYTTIKHQGFYGLTGNNGDYFNAVVRNHIYDITVQGIYGLGTPVIDPGLDIDPERPADEKPSYIKARINILPWRVVTNNSTLH